LNIAQRAINPVTYKGTRVEALYRVNDDWNVLISQMYQNLDSEGVFYQTANASDGAPLKPLEVTLFNPTSDKDKFENTAWTVNGKLGSLHAVYTGAYLVRRVEQIGDYTNYSRAVYVDYYQCYGPGTGGDAKLMSTCFSPSATWRETESNEHLSHEIRISTPDDWRLRGIAGAYYEDQKLHDDTSWQYKTVPSCTSNGAPGTPGNTGCFSSVGAAPGATVSNPGIQNDAASFIEDTLRETKQTAFFASVDYDIIPKVLTLTAGTRHYLFDNSLKGTIGGSFGCFEHGTPAGGCLSSITNIDAKGLSDTESGWRSRGNLTWHITPDAMLYYTYSQGFRPGGFNRTGGSTYINGPDGVPQFVLPREYKSDSLTNQEIGWKTEWFHHRIQWNGAVYRENWNNAQISFVDIKETGNLEFDANGQNFRIQGVETSIIARVFEGLTLQWAGSWNQSVQTNSPALVDTNPASVNFGKPITENCGASGANCVPISNLFGPIGSPTANSPPIQFSARARYEFSLEDYHAFVQFGATHTGHSFTQAGSNTVAANGTGSLGGFLRYENPAYTTYDASLGVAKDAWNAQLYVQNLTNSNASLFTNAAQWQVAETVLRPRVIGVNIGYKF
jgi:outer membrane receptor protein involved in Fe transport